MLHRIKKHADVNAGKWIGVGGKLEQGETVRECAAREMYEETGLTAGALDYRGIVYFSSDTAEDEEMHLFTCTEFSGELHECNEGVLKWIKKEEVAALNLWEGDRIFLKLLTDNAPFFRLRLTYKGDALAGSAVE